MKYSKAIATALAALTMLTGCGTITAEETTATADTVEKTVSPMPKEGKVLFLGQKGDRFDIAV